jgi:hypothetical protein
MQAALDDYFIGYNTRRPHQGRGMNGRTPLQALRDGIKKEETHTRNQLKTPPNPAQRGDTCQPITSSVQTTNILTRYANFLCKPNTFLRKSFMISYKCSISLEWQQ